MRRTVPDRRRSTWVVVGAAVALVVVAGVDALRSSNDEAAAPATTASRAEAPAHVGRIEVARNGTRSRSVGGVRVTFRVPAGWEGHDSISINKSTVGPQGAEAIIFWTSFPDGDDADPCPNLRSRAVGPSAADLATAVAMASGTKLVTGPSDVTLGGRAAKHVVLRVRDRVGCDPGFFYGWRAAYEGAIWTATRVGDTIGVWIVDVKGVRLFIEAETTPEAGFALKQEIQQIVDSVRFD